MKKNFFLAFLFAASINSVVAQIKASDMFSKISDAKAAAIKKNLVLARRCILITTSNNLNPSGSVVLSIDFAGYTAVVGTGKWFRDGVELPTWKGRNTATSTPGVYKYSIDVTLATGIKNIVSNEVKIELLPITTPPPPPPPPPPPVGTTVTTVTTQLVAGMNYRLFEPAKSRWATPKGILVIGSGNNESNPGVGAINGGAETSLAQMAADNGYVAAILGYEAGKPNPNNGTWQFWNDNAVKMGTNFDACISKLSADYNVSKTNSVVAGFSYTSFILLTESSLNSKLTYCKGLLAACGSTEDWNAQNLKFPIYAINCAGNYEGANIGQALYDKIPANSAIKAKSGGLTDASCNGHCAGNWTQIMFDRLKFWIP